MAPRNEISSHQHALPAVAVDEIRAVRRRSSVLSGTYRLAILRAKRQMDGLAMSLSSQ